MNRLFLILVIIFNCSYPSYESTIIETHDISSSISSSAGFTSDDNYFYILDLDLGAYDEVTGIQTYNYIHLNIYRKIDFFLNQTIDLTMLLNQLFTNTSTIMRRYNEYGPLVYFQNRVYFKGEYNAYYIIEFK
jgi:hypothetical protein